MFDTFVKSVPKDELESLVVPLRRTIEGTDTLARTVYPWDEVLGSRWGGAPRSGARGPGTVAGVCVVGSQCRVE